MYDYDNNGFGGSPHTSNAFEQAKRDERDSYRDMNERVAKSAYSDLLTKYNSLLGTVDDLHKRLLIAEAGLGHDSSHIEYDNAKRACDLTIPLQSSDA